MTDVIHPQDVLQTSGSAIAMTSPLIVSPTSSGQMRKLTGFIGVGRVDRNDGYLEDRRTLSSSLSGIVQARDKTPEKQLEEDRLPLAADSVLDVVIAS